MLTRLFTFFAAFILFGATAGAATAQTLQGEWRNTNNTVHLRVMPCGPAMCGTVTWATETARADARKGSGKELIGSRLFHNLKQSDDGKWRGKAYIPDVDSTASATITQLDNKLIRVSGCLFLGIVCRTQHWHRIQ